MIRAKICGITDLYAAKIAEEAGADFLGFVFYKPSPRYIDPVKAAVISSQIQKSRLVGVFVDEELDYVQLHGSEPVEYARQVDCPVIKAYHYDENFSVAEAEAYPAEMILLDAGDAQNPGGTGQSFDWQKAAQDIAQLHKSVIVAGGINRENALQANKVMKPYALDVSSSLEVNKEKSVEKIKAFLRRVK